MALAPSLRSRVWERAAARCEYCHMPSSADVLPFCVDHVLPKKHGGTTIFENLALACALCNRFKLDNLTGIDPTSAAIVTLFNPRRDLWAEHFAWERASLSGKSSSARATIEVLRINLAQRVEHRDILMLLGKFSLE